MSFLINNIQQNGLAWVHEMPLLDADQEHDLALAHQSEGDLQAAQTLILSHMRYVVRIAQSYQGYGLPVVDLVQEGAIGLMKAVKRFQPNKGARLLTFAVHWIKSEIHNYVIQNWRIVKSATTKAQRKLFFNLRKKREHLGWLSTEETRLIAQDLGVKISEVQEMEMRMTAHDVAFDRTADQEDAPLLLSPEDYLSATQEDPQDLLIARQESERQGQMLEALGHLDERQRHIIEKRWLCETKAPLKVLAEDLGVSMERVRQIEQSAIKTMTEHVDSDPH